MRILIDCRPLQYLVPGDERARLITGAAHELEVLHKIEFIYMIDKHGDEPVPGLSYIRQSALPGRPGWKLWYDWNIPRQAKKSQADWIMTTGGIVAGSNLPQIAWIPAISMKALTKGGGKQGAAFRKLAAGAKGLTGLMDRRLDKTLRTVRAICSFTAEDRDLLTARNKTAPIYKIEPVAGDLTPLAHTTKEEVKTRLAAGKEYFFTDITAITEDELLHLLQAFSRFKKRQLTNLQMVLGGTPAIPVRQITKKLDSYKYRQDVHWHREYTASDTEVPGAAYAVLRPFERKEIGLALAEAWKMEIPVIVSSPGLQETGNTTAAQPPFLYAKPGDTGALAEKLMQIYKDEGLRSRIIREGSAQMHNASVIRPSDLLLSVLTLQKAAVPASGLQSVN